MPAPLVIYVRDGGYSGEWAYFLPPGAVPRNRDELMERAIGRLPVGRAYPPALGRYEVWEQRFDENGKLIHSRFVSPPRGR